MDELEQATLAAVEAYERLAAYGRKVIDEQQPNGATADEWAEYGRLHDEAERLWTAYMEFNKPR